jgi:ABC-type uncharacterized transport system substrate-binding protein
LLTKIFSWRGPLIFLALQVTLSLCAQDKVLVFRSDRAEFTEVSEGLRNELDADFELVDQKISAQQGKEFFLSQVQQHRPRVLVVMDERSISLAKSYYLSDHPLFKNLPCVATGLNLKHSLRGIPQMCGVSYEVSPYQIITFFRYLSKAPLKKVLVPFRSSKHLERLLKARQRLAQEGILLMGLNVEKTGSEPKEIETFLEQNLAKELKKNKPDAVWVLSDSHMLTQTSFNKVWKPLSNGKIPFISGVKHLSTFSLDFCSFSCSPKHESLGSQLGQMVRDIVEEGLSPQEMGVETVLANEKQLNLAKFKKSGGRFLQDRVYDVKVLK